MNQEKSAMLAWSEEGRKNMAEVDRRGCRRCHLPILHLLPSLHHRLVVDRRRYHLRRPSILSG
jgi:hypothetical protein